MFLPAFAAGMLVLAQPPPRAYVGAYLSDVSDFDLKAGRFKVDMRVWVKWSGGETPPNLTFENGELDAKDELGRESDGDWRSVQWRVQGTFRGDFPVHAFPFDVQTLPVVFGLAEPGVQLVPDLGASGMSPRFSVTGWLYEPYFTARTEVRQVGSDLGSVVNEGKTTAQPRVSIAVEMRRPIAPYMFKFILPLALILLMALTALLLPPRVLEVRSAMGVTSLLSCIAFHYTQADTLPNVSYLVAADKLFLGAYCFVTLTLIASVVVYRSHESNLLRAIALDRAGLALLPTSAAALTLVLVLTATPEARPAPVPPPVKERPTQPVLRIASYTLDTLQGVGGPQRRGQTLVKASTGAWQPIAVDEAPSMTNAMVRLLPEGGMRVRWRLKEGLRWSDGPRVTRDDLLFSLSLAANPLRTAVDPVDERTVDVTYARRRLEWLGAFPLYRKQRYAPAFADGGRDAVMRAANEPNVPSTAAYAFESFTPGEALVLARNPHFAGPRPVFDRVEVVKVDPGAAAEALVTGKVDVLPSLDGPAWAALANDPRAQLFEQPGDLLYLLVPNLDLPPWNDLGARKLLMAAIDRQALAAELAPLPAVPATGWRARAPGEVPAYAPDAAAAGLAQRGLEGHALKLHVATLKVKGGVVDRMVRRLVADLTAAGLAVEVVETAEAGQLFSRRAFDGLLFIARDTTDPSRLLNVPWVNGHSAVEEPRGAHFDATMVAAWERQASSLYDERHLSLEQSLQKEWAARLPMLPLVLTSRVFATRAGLQGPVWGIADSFYWNVEDWQGSP